MKQTALIGRDAVEFALRLVGSIQTSEKKEQNCCSNAEETKKFQKIDEGLFQERLNLSTQFIEQVIFSKITLRKTCPINWTATQPDCFHREK